MKIVYPGPARRVSVPEGNLVAERGEPVEVERDLARRLLAQGWQRAKIINNDAHDEGRKE